MSTKRKLRTLTLQEKIDVLHALKGGRMKKDVAAQYGIPPSTLSTIIKHKAEILEGYETTGNLCSKRRRQPVFPDVEECLFTWFKQCRDKNISVSGPILCEKAEEFGKSLGHNTFRASNGWLGNFKKRHELFFRKISGGTARVKVEICDEWDIELKTLLQDYEPEDVFNATETGLFFKCLPDKTLLFKNEKCHDGKHSKERFTILLATNMTGSEQLKPLVIGKVKKPRSSFSCKSLPLDYDANNKAWMTAEIFKGWLLKLDKKMIKEKRNILLFIDNSTAHNIIPPLKTVVVKYFPPNTSSTLQPLDNGIIRSFKFFYRKEVARKLLIDMEQETASSISVLHAIRMTDKAWRSVSATTISNCFKSCGFLMPEENALERLPEPNMSLEADWSKLRNIEVQFEDYVRCDEGVATSGTLTDAEIINIVNKNTDNDNGNDVEHTDPANVQPSISSNEARAALTTLRTYIERCDDIEDDIFSSLFDLEKIIDKKSAN